jgi:cobalt/nickel transport system permease protein
MHIPDGFLSANALIPSWILSIGGLAFSVKKATRSMKDKTIPLMGVMAAFIFAAQMLNFPIVGGTSGHLLGGALAAILLGPYAGAIVIALVLLIQCVIFQDGGLVALGANILNMSYIGVFSGFFTYNIVKKTIGQKTGIIIGSFAGAWLSVVLASAACAVELAVSGTSPINIALPAMVGVHALIGIGEGIITCLVVGFVLKTRPDLIYGEGGNI